MTNLSDIAKDIFTSSLEFISPLKLVRAALRLSGDILFVNNDEYQLDSNVYVVGFGKAVYGMALGVQSVLEDHIVQGILSVPLGLKKLKHSNELNSLTMKVLEGGENNLPDKNALDNAEQIKQLVTSLHKDDILIVLISGGGSALLPAPVKEITLQEKLETIRCVASAGGTIQQLNTVRKKLSLLKGGKLASLCLSDRIISLIISDIVGDPIDLIASAPTVLDTSSYYDCSDIFSKLSIEHKIPQAVKSYIDVNLKKDVEKVVDHSGHPNRCHNYVVGSNKILVDAISKKALELGFQPIVLTTALEGDAERIGHTFAELVVFSLLQAKEKIKEALQKLCKDEVLVNNVSNALILSKNLCLITAGECTVHVTGKGKGGRNQHLILSALLHFQELSFFYSSIGLKKWCLLSAGSDGQDGPTDAAGALCTEKMIEHINTNNVDVKEYLKQNSSYDFFEEHLEGECLIKTGLTGTNVMDIQMVILN